MLSSFVIVLREGFEAFLIVAITLAYLRKAGRAHLAPAVYWAIAASVLASAGLGWVLMQGANLPLWEGIMGLVAIPFIIGLVVHMWRVGPRLKENMEEKLGEASSRTSRWAAFLGVFAFTLLMVSREGMETALMLFQVQSAQMVQGALLGLAAAGLMAWAWAHYGHRVNLRRFFQVTGIFLLLFTAQIAIYALHELSEAGLVVNDAVMAFHMATEPYSPYGNYGKWFPLLMVGIPALWLLSAAFKDRLRPAEV
jgi:high-affinity iron transporter